MNKMQAINSIDKKTAEELFESDDKVLLLLSDIKWRDGFICRSCGHSNYCEGKSCGSRRCTRCKKEESASAHTLFHNVKFPIRKAFFIAWSVCMDRSSFSANNYSEMLGINPMTCWKFRKRIQKCILESTQLKAEKSIKDILMFNGHFE